MKVWEGEWWGYSALLGFHRKVECSLGLWSTYRDPREPSGGRKVKSAWQTGSSGPSECLPSRFQSCASIVSTLSKAYFDGFFLSKSGEKIEKARSCVAQSLVFEEADKRRKLFAQLNLNLEKNWISTWKKTESQLEKNWISNWKKMNLNLEKNWISTWKKLNINLEKTETQLEKNWISTWQKTESQLEKNKYQLRQNWISTWTKGSRAIKKTVKKLLGGKKTNWISTWRKFLGAAKQPARELILSYKPEG